MGEKIYYIVEVLIFVFLGYYFVTKPQDILKIFKQEENKQLYMVVRVFGAIVAIANIAISLRKLFL